jgi:hypothetical protein
MHPGEVLVFKTHDTESRAWHTACRMALSTIRVPAGVTTAPVSKCAASHIGSMNLCR